MVSDAIDVPEENDGQLDELTSARRLPNMDILLISVKESDSTGTRGLHPDVCGRDMDDDLVVRGCCVDPDELCDPELSIDGDPEAVLGRCSGPGG
jgi:hypothetical protein